MYIYISSASFLLHVSQFSVGEPTKATERTEDPVFCLSFRASKANVFFLPSVTSCLMVIHC